MRAGAETGLVRGTDGRMRPVWASENPVLMRYYDEEWGVPVRDERGLFERLSLEAFQAGLAWRTVLEKREAFRAAFVNFDPDRVAGFDEEDVQRLLGDASIIRNAQKIRAVIHNAERVVALREDGGLSSLIWSFQPDQTPAPRRLEDIPTRSPESEALAKALKARGFKFVGPVMLFATMEAIGMVDTHLVGSDRRGSSGLWDANGRRRR